MSTLPRNDDVALTVLVIVARLICLFLADRGVASTEVKVETARAYTDFVFKKD